MSILLDQSLTDSSILPTSLGFLTGLQKGTLHRSLTLETVPTFSYYFVYSSDDESLLQEYGVGVTTDTVSATSTPITLSSLSQLDLSEPYSSDDGSLISSSSPSASSSILLAQIDTTTSTNLGGSLHNYRDGNSKLVYLVGTMVGLSMLLTTL